MNITALNWWLDKQGKPHSYSVRNRVIVEWNVPGLPKPTDEQLLQMSKDYHNSKEYYRDNFSYEKCMEDLNMAFWNRMSALAPVVGLVDLWLRWKNFTALKIKSAEWIKDPKLDFTLNDFKTLNAVMQKQNIDLNKW